MGRPCQWQAGQVVAVVWYRWPLYQVLLQQRAAVALPAGSDRRCALADASLVPPVVSPVLSDVVCLPVVVVLEGVLVSRSIGTGSPWRPRGAAAAAAVGVAAVLAPWPPPFLLVPCHCHHALSCASR